MPKALVFDLTSYFQIAACDIQDEWFVEYQIPLELHSIKRILRDDIIYFIDEKTRSDEGPFVIIDLSDQYPIFKQDSVDRYVLDRISTITRATYTNSVSIPYSWHSTVKGDHSSPSTQPPKMWAEALEFISTPIRPAPRT